MCGVGCWGFEGVQMLLCVGFKDVEMLLRMGFARGD